MKNRNGNALFKEQIVREYVFKQTKQKNNEFIVFR